MRTKLKLVLVLASLGALAALALSSTASAGVTGYSREIPMTTTSRTWRGRARKSGSSSASPDAAHGMTRRGRRVEYCRLVGPAAQRQTA